MLHKHRRQLVFSKLLSQLLLPGPAAPMLQGPDLEPMQGRPMVAFLILLSTTSGQEHRRSQRPPRCQRPLPQVTLTLTLVTATHDS